MTERNYDYDEEFKEIFKEYRQDIGNIEMNKAKKKLSNLKNKPGGSKKESAKYDK